MAFFTKKGWYMCLPMPPHSPPRFRRRCTIYVFIYCTKIFVIRHCILTELHVKFSDSVLSIPAREPVIWN